VVKEVGEHNHEKRNAEIATKRVLAEIKEKAETEPETPQQILASVSAGMSAAVAAKLPKVSLLKRTIQRKRQQASGALPCPTTLRDLVIPDNFKKTLKEEDFLAFNSGAEENRVIIFATNRNLDLLSSSAHWYADGTFKTALRSSPSLYNPWNPIRRCYSPRFTLSFPIKQRTHIPGC